MRNSYDSTKMMIHCYHSNKSKGNICNLGWLFEKFNDLRNTNYTIHNTLYNPPLQIYNVIKIYYGDTFNTNDSSISFSSNHTKSNTKVFIPSTLSKNQILSQSKPIILHIYWKIVIISIGKYKVARATLRS